MKGEEHGAGADESIAEIVGFLFGHAQKLRGLRGHQDLHRAFAMELGLVALGGVNKIEDGFLGVRRITP